MAVADEHFSSHPEGSQAWPEEIRLSRAERILHIRFDDGTSFQLPAEYLRVESPSAEVQGHGPGQKKLISGKGEVAILAVEPVGNYAIRLKFDDGHDTGIYSWTYLHRLGTAQTAKWEAYLAALHMNNLSR